MKKIRSIISILIFSVSFLGGQSLHPNLVLTSSDVSLIQKSLGSVPLFDKTLAIAIEKID